MKKLVILLIAVVCLTGCGNGKQKEESKKAEKEQTTIKVKNGQANSVNVKGYVISLKNENGIGIINLQNKDAKADLGYTFTFNVNQSVGTPLTIKTDVNTNDKVPYNLLTEIDVKKITSIDYKVAKRIIVKKGNA